MPLSNGQRKCLGIARAIVAPFEMLILDEPMSFLDEEMNVKFSQMLKQWQGQHTLLVVSHDCRSFAWADQQIYLHPSGGDIIVPVK